MYYMKDILSMGGITINEQVIKKGMRFTVCKALLYLAGEKFHVIVKEYEKGHGLILEVLEKEGSSQEEEYQKIERIRKKYYEPKHSLIRAFERERDSIHKMAAVLQFLILFVGMRSAVLLTKLYERGMLTFKNVAPLCIALLMAVVCYLGLSVSKNYFLRN